MSASSPTPPTQPSRHGVEKLVVGIADGDARLLVQGGRPVVTWDGELTVDDARHLAAGWNHLEALLDACKGLLNLPDAHTAEKLSAVTEAAITAIADAEKDLEVNDD